MLNVCSKCISVQTITFFVFLKIIYFELLYTETLKFLVNSTVRTWFASVVTDRGYRQKT